MIRIAFTLIGGKNWTGGYNYLLNLVQALSQHSPDAVMCVMFFGSDIAESDAAPFEDMRNVSIVRSPIFDVGQAGQRLRRAILTGCDQAALDAFREHNIDVVFETAQFYGWRFPIPVLAWITDFQHRHMRHLFGFKAYWKREIGFRAQVLSSRHIMLSSKDARQDCERFYPHSRSRTHVVSFAVPGSGVDDDVGARSIADNYDLPEKFFFLPNQFWKHKNHECVVLALQILKKRGREIVVAATGKQTDPRNPGHFERLQHLISTHGLERNFRVLGLIPHQHISALMRSCTALINPSTFEGWSTTVEEAKAAGTPMILSSLAVHREQRDDALFFDATSPEQLANILEAYTPICREERLTLSAVAQKQASLRLAVFVAEFVGLIRLVVNRR